MKHVAAAFAALALMSVAPASIAAEITKLPETAKQLTKDEIIAAYSGKSLNWSHPVTDKGTGTTVVDATASTMSGTYDVGGNKGEWEGKISWKGEQYCYQTKAKGQKKLGKKTCTLVYQEGETFIEVDPKTKKVLSVNTYIK